MKSGVLSRSGVRKPKQKFFRKDWIFLLPLVCACIVTYLRFPVLQNDDHLKVVRFIAREHRWPPAPKVDQNNQAQHTLFHHSIAAVLYQGLESMGGYSLIKPERGVQFLSLFWALGIIFFTWLTVRRVIKNNEARILAFLIFGTFASWVWSAVTIDNDMAMGFWGAWALWVAVIMMQTEGLPRWRIVGLLGLLIGIAAFTKATASVMAPVAVISLLARRWLRGEKWRPLLLRALLLVLVWGSLAGHNYWRYWRDTGYPLNHQVINPCINEERWDYFSFRFMDILKRPFKIEAPDAGELLTVADYSFWSKLYITWWRLPGYLPHAPNPIASSALYAMALPAAWCAAAGFFLGIAKIRQDPAWLPLAGWLLIGLIGMFIGSWYRPTVHYGSFINPRFISYATASPVAVLAFAFQKVIERWPRLRRLIWGMVFCQVIVFWWLLLSGPFYSFWETVPAITCP